MSVLSCVGVSVALVLIDLTARLGAGNMMVLLMYILWPSSERKSISWSVVRAGVLWFCGFCHSVFAELSFVSVGYLLPHCLPVLKADQAFHLFCCAIAQEGKAGRGPLGWKACRGQLGWISGGRGGVYCLFSCFAFGKGFFDSFNVTFNDK